MTKVVMIGWSPIGEGFVEVFCKIDYDEEKDSLSICGVEGPQPGGDCIGGCGQIIEHMDEEYIINLKLSSHWTLDMLRKFLAIWRKYHLNDLRPECEHQRALGWKPEPVKMITYELNKSTIKKRSEIKARIYKEVLEKGQVSISPTEQEILELDYKISLSRDEELPGNFGQYYREKKSWEVRFTSWLTPKEHPKGLLGKPCPVCGYKYGSRWNHFPVPREVIEFLESLPDAEKKPAWV